MRTTLSLALAVFLGCGAEGCFGLIGDSHQLDGVTDEDEWGDDDPLGCDIVVTLARGGCTQSGCHGAAYKGNLDLASPGVADRLVNVRSHTTSCSGERLVDPANVDNSLILKATNPDAVAAGGICTDLMPMDHDPMTADDRACLSQWVQEIVDAWGGGPVTTFDAALPETYAAKVKGMLTGEPVTTADLAAVNADATALRSLVDDWMEKPGFRTIMAGFFSNALQSRVEPLRLIDLITSAGNIVVRLNGATLPDQLDKSVTTTAVDMVVGDEDFRDIAKTNRWYVNTALLTLIAYFDLTVTERQTSFHAVTRGTAPLALATSIATRNWVFPEQPADCALTRLPEPYLLATFFGTLRCSQAVALDRYPILAPSDFADWRYVELETGTPTVKWYDLIKMRTASKLVVSTPRTGFYRQLPFLANWLTNKDNKYRVTINQTLIASLDATFSAADPTGGEDGPLPSRIDADHAEKGTQCYGCHRLMDPMRGYFESTMAYDFSRQATPLPSAFAFMRSATQMNGDLGSALASHPRFAMAWTQKLCMFATAHRCDEGDPEVKRVAEAFADSGYKFKALVRELFTSPLITEAAYTDTFETYEPFISISRRNHMCALLTARTHVANICSRGAVAQALSFIPDDEFTRGDPDLLQATGTSPFHNAAADRLCNVLPPYVVDNAASSHYPPRSANIVELIVDDFMGLPVGHSRHDDAVAALTSHIAAARAAGASVDNASRSAFIAACMSTDILATGM